MTSSLNQFALFLVLLPILLAFIAFVGYPAVLALITLFRRNEREIAETLEWPEVTITLPVYNEERMIKDRIENILAFDYPKDRLHVLVLSDASTDRTDEIAAGFADRGVMLVRLPVRAGKGEAENVAFRYLKGEVSVNVDATTVLQPGSLKALMRAFADPTVGVASGRDVSIAALANESNSGEAGYVGYEMTVRRLETRAGGIVGASGCFFGIRRALYPPTFPIRYSRDFACPLIAQERGYRSVSVEGALCAVPRVPSLRNEFKRKVRTMHRGLETLWYKRELMNPFKHGWFAVKLVMHKLVRWIVPLSAFPAIGGLAILATEYRIAAAALAAVAIGCGLAFVALRLTEGKSLPKPLALPAFLVLGIVASGQAWLKLLLGNDKDAMWEPTRRHA